MIQRKQSLWLLLAALLNAGVLYFDLYKYHTTANGVDTPGQLRVSDHYPSLLIALVMILLPLVTIFMYKKRKQQIAMAFVSILAVTSFIFFALNRVGHIADGGIVATGGSYWLGAILPVISIIFLFLAILGIRKDDKLVRSADRLR
jgi:hypothetical protein